MALFFEKALTKQITFSFELDNRVPDDFNGDPYRLRQILTNLLANAFKFTDQGFIKLTITSETAADSPSDRFGLNFAVSDSGIGIAPENISKLFKSFSQADGSTTRKYGGTGLGLVICKELTERMDGHIEVASQPGTGSTFTLHLPLQKALAPVTLDNGQVRQLHGKSALIVEDHSVNAKSISHYLFNFGMSSQIAENGARALEILDQTNRKAQGFDFALLDMNMIGMSASQLTRYIRHDDRFAAMRIIILTNGEQENELLNIRASGCDIYLHKPLRQYTLQTALCNLLGNTETSLDEPNLSGLSVLLAEDNPVNQKITQIMLNTMGCEVTLAENGRQAVDLFEQTKFDLILMDCMMPEMDGYTATQAIRQLEEAKNHSSVPILALTANAMDGDREYCLSVGMTDYLAKPFLQPSLRHKIENLIKPVSSYNHHPAMPKPIFSEPAPPNISSTPAPETAKPFDPAALATLRNLGGSQLVSNVLNLFRENSALQLKKLQEGFNAKNNDNVRAAAHSLKSAAANVGGLYLAELAKKLEQAAREESLVFNDQQLQTFEAELQVLLSHLRQQESA